MSSRRDSSVEMVALCAEDTADFDTLKVYLRMVCNALDSAINGVLVTNLEDRVIYANTAAQDLFAHEQGVLGQEASALFRRTGLEGLETFWTHNRQTQKSSSELITRYNGDEADMAVEMTVCPITDNAENIAGHMAVFINITHRRKMQEQLARYKQLAMLGQLSGGVAHEMRNTLGLIKGSAHFLDMSLVDPSPEVDKAVAILKNGVRKSDQIVDSLLKVARPKPATRREVDVNQVVQNALDSVRLPENVNLTTQLNTSLPETMADAGQINLIIDNLVRNAIQAMHDGGELKVTTDVRDKEWIVISVADTGIGIPTEDQETLFEPLVTKKSGGIGLGLALVQILTEGHGGHVELESEVGQGSVFSIHLPIDTAYDAPIGNRSKLGLDSERKTQNVTDDTV